MATQNQNIVVVDDDESMNQAVKRLLNAAGYRTATYPSAEALLEAGPPDDAGCFIFDIHLPGLSGFELRQRLVQGGSQLPVIFVTAFDDPESQVRAEKAGAIAFFTKPFQGRKLVAAIATALASHSTTTTQTEDE